MTGDLAEVNPKTELSEDLGQLANATARRPPGGYVLVCGRHLLAVWASYRAGLLRWADVRLWLAVHEVAERRSVAGLSGGASIRHAELAAMIGSSRERDAGSSLLRLETSGAVIVDRDAGAVRWVTTVAPGSHLRDDLGACASQHPSLVDRSIPIPRRLLRWAASGQATASEVAQLLIHCWRCCWARAGVFRSSGTCRAALASEALGCCPRSAKSARASLISRGILSVADSGHWHRQRHGSVVDVNGGWLPDEAKGGRSVAESRAEIAPPGAESRAEIAPPSGTEHPSGRVKNHTPAVAASDGVPLSGHQRTHQSSASGGRGLLHGSKRTSVPRVTREQLNSPNGMARLYRACVRSGALDDSDESIILIHAAACWAIDRGDNPAALLRHALANPVVLATIPQRYHDRGLAMLRSFGGIHVARSRIRECDGQLALPMAGSATQIPSWPNGFRPEDLSRQNRAERIRLGREAAYASGNGHLYEFVLRSGCDPDPLQTRSIISLAVKRVLRL